VHQVGFIILIWSLISETLCIFFILFLLTVFLLYSSFNANINNLSFPRSPVWFRWTHWKHLLLTRRTVWLQSDPDSGYTDTHVDSTEMKHWLHFVFLLLPCKQIYILPTSCRFLLSPHPRVNSAKHFAWCRHPKIRSKWTLNSHEVLKLLEGIPLLDFLAAENDYCRPARFSSWLYPTQDIELQVTAVGAVIS
jgi:hypothetical protein